MIEKAWLIERKWEDESEYLCVDGRYDFPPSGHFVWLKASHYALRFSRYQDAMLFLGAFFSAKAELPTIFTWLVRGAPIPFVSEHQWGSD